MSLTIDIAVEHDAWTRLEGRTGVLDLDALAHQALAAAAGKSGVPVPSDAEVSIVLCDDAFIQTLNRTWRGKDRPTNVLSFPTADVDRGPAAMLGDIVIAYETCVREAAEEGIMVADHLAHLFVHGFLHLLGYDHEVDEEADAMEQLEALSLAAIGIASPYERAARERDLS